MARARELKLVFCSGEAGTEEEGLVAFNA